MERARRSDPYVVVESCGVQGVEGQERVKFFKWSARRVSGRVTVSLKCS